MRFKLSELPQWAARQQRVMDAVVAGSTSDAILESSKTATGVSRGGEVREGFVPRADGTLAASLVSTLFGTSALTQSGGEYALVVGAMKAGDVAEFRWTAPYAAAKHFGTATQPGWFWVDRMAVNWGAIVDRNVAKARLAVR